MEWNYSECGGDSDVDEEDSNPDPNQPMSASFNAEQTEVLQVLRQTLELPKGLCAQPDVFWEFFAPENLWNELPQETRDELMAQHLPQFPPELEVDEGAEKEATLQMLFHREAFRFNSSPLVDFQRNLEQGNYLQDVVKYRAKIAKSERREQRFQECDRISRMASRLVESRKELLQAMNPKASHSNNTRKNPKRESTADKTLSESVAMRARKRYMHEMKNIMLEANLPLSESDDEEHSLTNSNINNNNIRIPRKQGRPSLAMTTATTTDYILSESGAGGLGIPYKINGTFAYKPSKSTNSVADLLLPKTAFNDDYLKHALRRHKKRKTEEPVS